MEALLAPDISLHFSDFYILSQLVCEFIAEMNTLPHQIPRILSKVSDALRRMEDLRLDSDYASQYPVRRVPDTEDASARTIPTTEAVVPECVTATEIASVPQDPVAGASVSANIHTGEVIPSLATLSGIAEALTSNMEGITSLSVLSIVVSAATGSGIAAEDETSTLR